MDNTFVINPQGIAVDYIPGGNYPENIRTPLVASMVEWYNNLPRTSATRVAKRQMLASNDWDSELISAIATS